MTTSFYLPDLGEGIHEAEILAVPVEVNQYIHEGDVILEVETDKAAVEIPSPVTGKIEEIHVRPGDLAKVGDILLSFTNESAATWQNDSEEILERVATQKKQPVPASPSTRRLARELGVDLHLVTPSGSNGVVSAEDVRRGANLSEKKVPIAEPAESSQVLSQTISRQATSLPDFSQWGLVELKPFRSIRRATAIHMTASWEQIPHVNCQDMVDITKLEKFRQRYKTDILKAGGRLTLTVFAMKAVATALKNFQHFNASLDLVNQQIIIKKYFHIGVAVDTEQGLVVPVIRDVDRKSIKELAIELNIAIERARSRKTSREEMLGGTFTITNAGAIGGSHFTAIINHPEIAILGMGQGRMHPIVITDEDGDNSIAPRLMMPIVLCFDHRVADGADAIRFLQTIISALEDPDELLITMI
jgi:pyruvate dehydrogenase E2 component (dihydrolipoamide acetyltransferase)